VTPLLAGHAEPPAATGTRALTQRSAEGLPPVSVILATRCRPTLVVEVVTAVLDDPAVLEVVAVIDGDDHASKAALEAVVSPGPQVKVFSTPHVGQLAALDLGVEQAEGDVVLLLDDDVVPEPGLASGHARIHARRSGVVVMGSMPVELPEDAAVPVGTLLYAKEYEAHVRALEEGHYGTLDHLWTGNLSLPTADCRRVGLRSADFSASYHADLELGLRLRQAGLAGVFEPSLAARHLHRRADRAFLRDAQRSGAGQALLARLHPGEAFEGSPRRMTADLPPLLRGVVRSIGVSPAATPAAIALMAVGRLAGQRSAVASAKLARRLMLCHGAVRGEPVT
jgi:hypothetical protein